MATVKKIYGTGSPLLDISSEVDAEMLTKYGLKAANAILAEESHIPLYDELAARPDVQYIPGGATLNSIRVANWMLSPVAPGSCAYTGCIGNDKFGNILAEKAAGEGLLVPFMRTDEKQTGTCGVLVTGKERSLVANLSAATCFQQSHLDTPDVKKLIEASEIFYIAGFFLTVSVDSILQIATHAAETNKTFCFNISAPFIAEFFGAQLHQVLPYVDILFSNEDEAKAYAKANNLGTEDVAEIAKVLVKAEKKTSRPRTVIFTQGKDPTIVATPEGVTSYPVDLLEESKLVDTNGAGDSFVGGFLAYLAQGASTEVCVQAGHYGARTIIQHSGCTFPAKPEFKA